jgi:hypothetical protein
VSGGAQVIWKSTRILRATTDAAVKNPQAEGKPKSGTLTRYLGEAEVPSMFTREIFRMSPIPNQ